MESVDFYVFYEGIATDPVKSTIFAVQALFSAIIEFPQILATCIPGAPPSQLAIVLANFSDSIMTLAKGVIYLDTSITQLLIGREYIVGGYYGMYSLLNFLSFVAFIGFHS